jgi:hypothetical protein
MRVAEVCHKKGNPPVLTNIPDVRRRGCPNKRFDDGSKQMHELIYLVGLIVVVMAILSFFGLR